MAEWVGSNMYIQFADGDLAAPVEVQARWKKIKIEGKVEEIDVTRGPNRKHYKRTPGMHDRPMEITLGVDDTSIYPAELTLDKIYTVTICVNGNVEGEPMHVQKYFITSLPVEVETGRGERVYAVTLSAADTPTTDMFEGGVVPAA